MKLQKLLARTGFPGTGREAPEATLHGGSILTDYNDYAMDRREKVRYTAGAAAALFGLGLIFFGSIAIAVVFSLGSFMYPQYKAKELREKRKTELSSQFKDALYCLSSALGAGRSLEGAFRAALDDLRILYPDCNTHILKEFARICRRIELNEPAEDALLNFAERSGVEDIRDFAEVMQTCKRTGGNLVQVARNTSAIISDRIEIRQEIELLLSKQKFEQKVLNIMPVVFIALIRFGGSGYMDSLYTSPLGYLLMFGALSILAVSAVISKKVLDIRV